MKILYYWMQICKGLLEFRQVTPELIDKLAELVSNIVSIKDEEPFSAAAVSNYMTRGGIFDWVKALLELAKVENKDLIKIIKETALEALVLIHHIKNSLQIISYFLI